MNILKKAYSRVFQTAFRIAIPILPYREPISYSRTIETLVFLRDRRVKDVLLVTDAHIRQAGLTRKLEDELKNNGINCTVYDGTRPNPTVKNVEEALKLYKDNGCQALIAFGGGSPMDCAKAVGARVAYPKKQLYDMKGILKVLRKTPPLIAIPTTAGTGSEVTVSAVITDDEKHYKYTMNNFTLIPDCAVHDATVTYTLPPSLTATTGMDALTHAVEAFIGRSTTKKTRKLSMDAAKLIISNIERAYSDPTDHEARAAMLKAAYMAGMAFSVSYVGYIHAVAHSLGGQYNIPHGLANSVLLPKVLEDMGEAIYEKLKKLAVFAGIADITDTPEAAAKKFIAKIKLLNSVLGIPDRLEGIRKEDIPLMAKHADKEANPLYPVPVLMDAKELEKYYYMVM
ncbi:MAG: iron-containing alcohol dehydrogenase [Christensenellaceae bacterium]|nr:iron-containing alcohol dehydrogenase [Christensenellaceae bacterium]